MNTLERPANIIWDITHACPLRCTHCYPESGRQAIRQLSHADMVRVADALISLRPAGIALAGGEPLVVKGCLDIAGRIRSAGIPVVLYTSGWSLDPHLADDIAATSSEVVVSVDSATAEIHDRIRGRVGSFERAMKALTALDGVAAARRHRGEPPLRFGIECVAMQSNIRQLADFCTTIAPRFPELGFISFGAVVPAGLASGPGFEAYELLDDDQVRLLGGAEHARYLQSLSPASVQVTTTDNRELRMPPDLIARGRVVPVMQVEPNGDVRAMPVYEGTVGNVLTESPAVLWKRAVRRWSDFVLPVTSGARA